MSEMRLSAKGKALIVSYEGERLETYRCSAGVLTIGIGHTGPDVIEGMRITKEQSAELFRKDIARFEDAVNQAVRVPLEQNQFDALVSFSFNVGEGAFRRSTLLRQLNKGNYDRVPQELLKWTRAGGKEVTGLVRRRRAEASLWRDLDRRQSDGPVQAVDEPTRKPLWRSREAVGGGAVSLVAASTAISEITLAVEQAGDAWSLIARLTSEPWVLALLIIAIVGALIAYWRWGRLLDNGE